ncbi:hypothetical protein AVEN_249719-1 [Araneus ventricosus]|uniref:Uncharacterized protein n=1 Tax=Araneus ventricosus TaxID=182803 RepID=A0A4Y2C7C8_ARAVE|nr:hypothetical protein AVEN_249719-1 [Araneus ventricosus]
MPYGLARRTPAVFCINMNNYRNATFGIGRGGLIACSAHSPDLSNNDFSYGDSLRDLLRILWKTKEEEEPVAYRLKTLTYGTKNVPFLATRVLRQLVMDKAKNFQTASEVVLSGG